MASTRADKYKEKRAEIEKMNESVAPKKKNTKVVRDSTSKESILEDLGIDTSFGLEEKTKPSSLEKLNKQQEEIYHTQEMKKISDLDIKRESSISKIMDTMKQDMPLNDNVTNIKPAKRTQIAPEFVSAKEKYGKQETKQPVVQQPRPKLVIKDNTKKEKEMPKTSATKVMGVDDILEVKAKQNSTKNRQQKIVKKSKITTDVLMMRICCAILAIAIISIVIVLLVK